MQWRTYIDSCQTNVNFVKNLVSFVGTMLLSLGQHIHSSFASSFRVISLVFLYENVQIVFQNVQVFKNPACWLRCLVTS